MDDKTLELWRTNPELAKLIDMLDSVLCSFTQDMDFEFLIEVQTLYIDYGEGAEEVCSLEKLNHFIAHPDVVLLKMSDRCFWRLTEGGAEKCPELD